MKSFRILILPAAAAGILLSASCAASRGFGQDLQKLGGKIEQRADETGGAAPSTSPPPPSTGIYTPPPATPSAY